MIGVGRALEMSAVRTAARAPRGPGGRPARMAGPSGSATSTSPAAEDVVAVSFGGARGALGADVAAGGARGRMRPAP